MVYLAYLQLLSNSFLEFGAKMNLGFFQGLNGFVNDLFTDVWNLGFGIFGLGILFCALATVFGGEEGKRTFTKWLGILIVGIVIFALARALVAYVRQGV